jgi:hypothetical protein
MRSAVVGKSATLAVGTILIFINSVVQPTTASSSSSSSSSSSQLHRDDAYYPAGTFNPLVSNAMYWRDAKNVLTDLSQFESLAVKYEHCV